MTIQNTDDAVTLNESSQQSADMQQTEYNNQKRARYVLLSLLDDH